MNIVTTSPAVFEEINEEHQWLKQMYAKIRAMFARGPGQLGTLRRLFLVLAEEVDRHFAHEEEGGYFDEVVEVAPRLASRVEELRQQHISLLETLQEMCRLFDEAEDTSAWWQAIENDFERFLSRCEEHESQENELVQDAWLQDLGVAD